MAKVKPFPAVVYNQNKVSDISKLVCPPYDVISSQAQEYYHELSPYNLIHILLRKDEPGVDKYKRAGNIFQDWLQEKVLIKENTPAVYFYQQQYSVRGERRTRLGFIALLHLGENTQSALAHENTRALPKQDRLNLIREVKANLSPIFIVFKDKKRIIQRVFQQLVQKDDPFIDIADNEKTVHRVWRVDSPELLKKIEAAMKDEDVFIADGHHRYEVAREFREEVQKQSGPLPEGSRVNYILSYFTNTDPRGLTIYSIHRLLKLDKSIDMAELKSKLKEYFDIEEVKDRTRFFFLMEKAGRSEHLIGMYKEKKFWLLRLKNIKTLDKYLKDKPKEYRELDVSILNQLIFENIIGLNLEDKDKACLIYTPHADEVISEVDNSPLTVGFFLNPVKIEQIMSLALKDERMPPKSTYFYPKVLSGLVINKFEQDDFAGRD